MKKLDLPEVDPVEIKPLFGMKPGVWLTILYAIILSVAVFLVGFLPDMLDGSKRVTFTSDAYNAAVYVDGVYEGGTPFTRKIESGTHDISFQVNGNEIDRMTVKVSHPVFFNWLFPRTQKIASSAILTQAAYESVCAELLEDANAYSAILSYDASRPYANIYTTFAKSVVRHGFEKSVLEAAFQFVTTDAMYQDALNACQILGITADIPYAKLDGKTSVGATDAKTPALTAKATTLKTDYFTLEGFEIPAADFSNGRTVTATYPGVKEAGKTVHTDTFKIGSYCVTEYQFSQFVLENPQWALSNKDNLIAQGLVDDYYLDGVTISTMVMSLKPVRNVSYYAAQAFCQWMSEITGKTVFLPSENQWIAACLTDSEGGYLKSLTPPAAEGCPAAMIGGLWEITDTPFIPLARIASDNADQMLATYNTQVDMVVKGGSYVNSPSAIDRYSVGTTYRSLCSDYMGFRVAWN